MPSCDVASSVIPHLEASVSHLQIRILTPFERRVETVKYLDPCALLVRPKIHGLKCPADETIRVGAAQNEEYIFLRQQSLQPDECLSRRKVETGDERKVDDL